MSSETKNRDTEASLWWAAENGDYELVVKLLESGGIDPNSRDRQDRTPLHLAAENGYDKIVERLLAAGANPNLATDERAPLWWALRNGHRRVVELLLKAERINQSLDGKKSPLHIAAKKGHREIVEMLLAQFEMDPGAEDEYGNSPLSFAARKGHEGVARLLLQNLSCEDFDIYTVNRSLFEAACKGNEAIVKLLLESGANPNSETGLETPLSMAARGGHEAVVGLLLTYGAYKELNENSYRSPICTAACHGHTKIVKLLLQTLPSGRDSERTIVTTALHWAAEYGQEEVVNFLLNDTGVSLDMKEEGVMGSLFEAAQSGYQGIVKLLLENCERVSDPGIQYEQPLWGAAKNGHAAIVELLLGIRGVDTDAKDPEGKTPLYWAAKNGHTETFEVLLNTSMVVLDSRDKKGKTPLLRAAKNGHQAIVEMLLNTGGVDPNSTDQNNKTPLWWATKNKKQSVVELLIKNNNVDVNIADTKSHRTPLALAARNGDFATMELLLNERNADQSIKDIYSVPPLWWTAQNGDESAIKQLCNLYPTSKVNINNEIDYRCLSYWLNCCDSNHSGCCQKQTDQTKLDFFKPQWIIDTENACIVLGQDVPRYIALSYVWNSSQDPYSNNKTLLLNTSNVQELQEPGFFRGPRADILPLVIKETMELVRRVGVRYLWVDRFCIVQDSQEKKEQIEHMDAIYSGAYLTVIAATSSGVFGEKPRNIREPTESDKDTMYHYEMLYGKLMGSKWATRGWTYQEHILSNRAAIFVDGDLFWDCRQSLWDRNVLLPSIVEGAQRPLNTYYQMQHRMSTTTWPDFSLYMEMIGLYNSRDFTYPQDALPAISGVLNSLGYSFPSGFVSGLPRLFLDSALLWQPFSKARRRQAKQKDTENSRRNLPSWSWCGWQCLIDPASLCTGLAYLDREHDQSQSGTSTWKSQRLVQWSILSDDMEQERQIDEPLDLQNLENNSKNKDWILPEGWTRHKGGSNPQVCCRGLTEENESVYFRHATDTTARFKYPVPINHTRVKSSPFENSWPFLACNVRRAFFPIRSIFKPISGRKKCAGMKMSVFELPQFFEGPAIGDICDIICLEDDSGKPAGQLRRMDDTQVVIGEKIELIAISSGSVGSEDLKSLFEERVCREKRHFYRRGLTCIFFDEITGNDDTSGDRSSDRPFQTDGESGGEFHFYNVLWIEREGEIAYRRAAGRVPKDVWEENCLESTRVILG